MFYANKADKTYGVRNRCKACNLVDQREYAVANEAHVKQRHIAWREKNAEEVRAKRRAYQAEWVAKNYDRKREMDREYERVMREKGDANFKARAVERNQRYYNSKLSATPPWADMEKIQAFYVQAQELTQKTGIRHEVDHIIPIQGKTVVGLHVQDNLRVIPWIENRRKSNRYDAHA